MTSGQEDQPDSFHYSARFSTAKRATHGGPLCTIKEQQRLRPTQRQLPYALRVRRCVDQVRAVQRPYAGWDACRRLDFQVRDLEARQARRYAPAALAVVDTHKDAEVRGDVQVRLCIVADDVVYRQVARARRRWERRRAGLDVQVREHARPFGRTVLA